MEDLKKILINNENLETKVEQETSLIERIRVNKYISGDCKAVKTILDIINKHRKILITGELGVGKTHFVREDLLKYANDIGTKIVLVIPGVCQLENLNENKGLSVVHGGVSYYDTDIVGVTPDSLLSKVLCHIKPFEYILVIDEAHQKILDNNFRKAFKNIDIAEKNALKIIYITATPRTIEQKSFEKVIEITTNSPIKNGIEILKFQAKSTDDDKLEIYRKMLKKYDNIIIFQNDKKINKIMAEKLAEGDYVNKIKYKDNFQYSIYPNCNVDSTTNIEWEWSTRSETVQSGKSSEETKSGLITANVTFVTSVIMAGIDLRVPFGNKGLLIIDGTERIDPDSFIQFIGRFREGIDVLILTRLRDESFEYEEFEDIVEKVLENNNQIAACINNSKFNIKYLDGTIKDNILELVSGIWKVDIVKSVAKSYEIWCDSILYNLPKLTEELKKQKAFEITSIKEVIKPTVTENEELKLARKAMKQEFEEVRDKIIEFNDKDIMLALNKNYQELNQEQQQVVKKYYELKPESHKEKLKMTGSLYTDSDGIVDVVKAFKKFYGNKWKDIQHKLDIKEAGAINRDIKSNGAEKYLDKGLYKTRTSKDIQQAKIRYELMNLEQKKGRLTDKIIHSVTVKMIDGRYIKNSNTRIYLDSNENVQDRKNAFLEVKGDVKSMIELVYNFKDNNIISSVKY